MSMSLIYPMPSIGDGGNDDFSPFAGIDRLAASGDLWPVGVRRPSALLRIKQTLRLNRNKAAAVPSDTGRLPKCAELTGALPPHSRCQDALSSRHKLAPHSRLRSGISSRGSAVPVTSGRPGSDEYFP